MIRNFTPHPVVVYGENGNIITTIEPEGVQVRINEETTTQPEIEGIPVVRKAYTDISGLPEQKEDVWIVVSVLVIQASDRTDLVCPDTGPESAVRNDKGHILGVKRFQKK